MDIKKLLHEFKLLINAIELYQSQPLVSYNLFIEFFMSFKKTIKIELSYKGWVDSNSKVQVKKSNGYL
jgi:hypothetical protein